MRRRCGEGDASVNWRHRTSFITVLFDLQQFDQIAGHSVNQKQLSRGETGELFHNGGCQQIGVRERGSTPQDPLCGGPENFAKMNHGLQRGTGQSPFDCGDELRGAVDPLRQLLLGQPGLFPGLLDPSSDCDVQWFLSLHDDTADITLGKGAVLKNYGGMSAVRVSGGVLTMETGSVICDDMGIVRIKGSEIPGENGSNISGLYGPAGAVWLQGGALKMESGSEICDIDGRAIYNEAGDVLIDGTISDITSNNAMWQGTSGFIMHMRVSATATLGSNGVIDGGSLKN